MVSSQPLPRACGLAGGLYHLRAMDDVGNAPRLVRLQDQPIVDRATFERAGVPEQAGNINGPSLVRVPDFIAPADRVDPRAVYYLYFAHHGGKSIRLAWASDVRGPWTLHAPGVLPLDASAAGYGRLIGRGILLHDHIASPDVHVDSVNQRLIMYFHAPTRLQDRRPAPLEQCSFVATSRDGLSWQVKPSILGYFYFRVFTVRGRHFAVSNKGFIYRAPEGWSIDAEDHVDPALSAWENVGNPFVLHLLLGRAGSARHPRHTAVRSIDNDTLECFCTRVGDAPERLQWCLLDTAHDDPRRWLLRSEFVDLLAPELPWEGIKHPNEPSKIGAQVGVRQLRDPGYFRDIDRSEYLLYSGAGEESLGIAGIER